MEPDIEVLSPVEPVKATRVRRKGLPKMNMKSKVAKYFVAHRVKGMSKTEAVKAAGISDVRNVANYEKMPTFQALEERYKDHLLKHIGLEQVAQEHAKNIMQDKNLAAKNTAIQMFIDKVEPEMRVAEGDNEMIVVLKAPN